jgi:1,4-dihydroxy-2-naphthoyl-CoA synthase
MAYETIRYEVDESILTITLNRPEKLNAIHDADDARADRCIRPRRQFSLDLRRAVPV